MICSEQPFFFSLAILMRLRRCQNLLAVVAALPMVGEEARMKMIWSGQDDAHEWQATCAVLLSKEETDDEHQNNFTI